MLPKLQQSIATLVRDVFDQLGKRIDNLENFSKALPTEMKETKRAMSIGMRTDYVFYSKDMALKDVPFAQAVLPAGPSKVDPFKSNTSHDES